MTHPSRQVPAVAAVAEVAAESRRHPKALQVMITADHCLHSTAVFQTMSRPVFSMQLAFPMQAAWRKQMQNVEIMSWVLLLQALQATESQL